MIEGGGRKWLLSAEDVALLDPLMDALTVDTLVGLHASSSYSVWSEQRTPPPVSTADT